MITSDLPQGVVINAVRRALNTWAGAGVGLTFRVITGGDIAIDADIRIEWRPAADPDYSMVGNVIAHSDYPPGCPVVTTDYPKPLHFDDRGNLLQNRLFPHAVRARRNHPAFQ